MNGKPLFSKKQYLQKVINTFCPRIILRLSPKKSWANSHWKGQTAGDIHGYDKYCGEHPATKIILPEISRLVPKDASILDLGCNCGNYLRRLKEQGFTRISGTDICGNAIEYGKKELGLSDVEMIVGSFDEVLPRLVFEGRKFQLVYTVGATVELVHPSFDVIRYVCELSDEYIVFIISLWGHAYPRFWEYEFNRNGFCLVKCITSSDGNTDRIRDPVQVDSLMVFRRVRPE
ncbi:MAG: class I SAM-dependent methyltransferase [Methanoregula sp.]|nr:class I SAM-dependent methyltransferase [Methanoregula sp.]